MSVDILSDYDTVKELILIGYEPVPDVFTAKKFGNSEKASGQSYVQFARRKEQLFGRCYLSTKNPQRP